MPVPLDEYPVHQVPLSMRHMATSDRNAYDRCYFNAHDRTGEVFLVTGMGVYPNLGVIDAYATVRRGDEQYTVRTSDALGDDRMAQRVGPYRIEVLEPLRAGARGVRRRRPRGRPSTSPGPARSPSVEEPAHVMRQGGRVILDAVALRPGGHVVGGAPGRRRRDRRERRPLGGHPRPVVGHPARRARPSRPGRAASEPDEGFGFWWTYVPLRFDDFAVVVIAQEDGDGTRIAQRGGPGLPGRVGAPARAARLARGRGPLPPRDAPPRVAPCSTCAPGAASRSPSRSRRSASSASTAAPATAATPTGPTGSGGDGAGPRASVVDMRDPAITGRIPFGVVDHVARATLRRGRGLGHVRARDLRPSRALGLHRMGVGGARGGDVTDRRADVVADAGDGAAEAAPRPRTSTRDRDELHRRLVTWLATQVHDPEVSELVVPESNGMSSETLLFDCHLARPDGRPASDARVTQACAARLVPDPDAVPVFPVYDLERQFRVMRLVARAHRVSPCPARCGWSSTPRPSARRSS